MTNEPKEVAEQELPFNEYTNPNAKRLIRSIYYFVTVCCLFLPLVNFGKKLRKIFPDVYKTFGDYSATVETAGIKILGVVAVVSAVWLVFNIVLFCLFAKLYQQKKPFTEQNKTDLTEMFCAVGTVLSEGSVAEKLKNKFLLKLYVQIKGGFCKEFKAELVNSAAEQMLLLQNLNFFAAAQIFTDFSQFINRKTKVKFSQYILTNAEVLNNTINPKTKKTALETVFLLQQKTEIPFILEPARTVVAENYGIDFEYTPYFKQKNKRKYSPKTKIVSFLLLCAALCVTEFYAILLKYSVPVLNDLFMDTFLLTAAVVVLILPVVIIDCLFLWITCANKKPKVVMEKELSVPFTVQEAEIINNGLKTAVLEQPNELLTAKPEVETVVKPEQPEPPVQQKAEQTAKSKLSEPKKKKTHTLQRVENFGNGLIKAIKIFLPAVKQKLKTALIFTVSVTVMVFNAVKNAVVKVCKKAATAVKNYKKPKVDLTKLKQGVTAVETACKNTNKAIKQTAEQSKEKLKTASEKQRAIKQKQKQKAERLRAERQKVLMAEKEKQTALKQAAAKQKAEQRKAESLEKQEKLQAKRQQSEALREEKFQAAQNEFVAKELTKKQKKQIKKLKEERIKLKKEREQYAKKMALKRQVERNKQIARQQRELATKTVGTKNGNKK